MSGNCVSGIGEGVIVAGDGVVFAEVGAGVVEDGVVVEGVVPVDAVDAVGDGEGVAVGGGDAVAPVIWIGLLFLVCVK